MVDGGMLKMSGFPSNRAVDTGVEVATPTRVHWTTWARIRNVAG